MLWILYPVLNFDDLLIVKITQYYFSRFQDQKKYFSKLNLMNLKEQV